MVGHLVTVGPLDVDKVGQAGRQPEPGHSRVGNLNDDRSREKYVSDCTIR
jgi:hypothetical protein